jgi:hypothetical protein
MNQKIIEKNGMKLIKLSKCLFNLTFDVKNDNIMLPSIINFELMQLIYKLNPTIFENMEIHNPNNSDTNIVASTLFKDIFSDLGLPQFYLTIHVIKENPKSDIIVFKCILIDKKLDTYPNDSEILPVKNIDISFQIITNHYVKINCDVELTEKHILPTFSEKIIGNIIYNIFIRLKQFIEKTSFNII